MDKSDPDQRKQFFCKVRYQGITIGTFAGKPKIAAAKAFVKLNPNVDEKYKLEVIEDIDEHDKTVYQYVAERVKLDEPKTISVGDKELTVNYQNRVTLLNE